MVNVGEFVFTVDSNLDKEGNPVESYIGMHEVARISIEKGKTEYEFVVGGNIFKVDANQCARSFEEMSAMITKNNQGKKICRRCGRIYDEGVGLSIEALDLCEGCTADVKEKLKETCDCCKGDCKTDGKSVCNEVSAPVEGEVTVEGDEVTVDAVEEVSDEVVETSEVVEG